MIIRLLVGKASMHPRSSAQQPEYVSRTEQNMKLLSRKHARLSFISFARCRLCFIFRRCLERSKSVPTVVPPLCVRTRASDCGGRRARPSGCWIVESLKFPPLLPSCVHRGILSLSRCLVIFREIMAPSTRSTTPLSCRSQQSAVAVEDSPPHECVPPCPSRSFLCATDVSLRFSAEEQVWEYSLFLSTAVFDPHVVHARSLPFRLPHDSHAWCASLSCCICTQYHPRLRTPT